MIDIKDKVILVTDEEQGMEVIEYLRWKGLENPNKLIGKFIGFYYGEHGGVIFNWAPNDIPALKTALNWPDRWAPNDLPTSKTILNWADCLAEWKPELLKPKELSMPGNPITLFEPTEMEVGDNGENWRIDLIYARYDGSDFPFIGEKAPWKYARPITPVQPVTISMKEALHHLSEKLNVKPDQIRING